VPKHEQGGEQTGRCEVMIITEKRDEITAHSSVLCIRLAHIRMRVPPLAYRLCWIKHATLASAKAQFACTFLFIVLHF